MSLNNSYYNVGTGGGSAGVGPIGPKGDTGDTGADSTVAGPTGQTGPMGQQGDAGNDSPGTNLSHSLGPGTVQINSDTGNNTVIQTATDSNAGVMRASDKVKLDTIPAKGFAPAVLGQSFVSIPTDLDRALELQATGIIIPNGLSWLLFQLNDVLEGMSRDRTVHWVDAPTLYDAATHNVGNILLIDAVPHPSFQHQGQKEWYYVLNSNNELLVTSSHTTTNPGPLRVWGL